MIIQHAFSLTSSMYKSFLKELRVDFTGSRSSFVEHLLSGPGVLEEMGERVGHVGTLITNCKG